MQGPPHRFQRQARTRQAGDKEPPDYSMYPLVNRDSSLSSISLVPLDMTFWRIQHSRLSHKPWLSLLTTLEYCLSLLTQYIGTESVQVAQWHFGPLPGGIDSDP